MLQHGGWKLHYCSKHAYCPVRLTRCLAYLTFWIRCALCLPPQVQSAADRGTPVADIKEVASEVQSAVAEVGEDTGSGSLPARLQSAADRAEDDCDDD